MPAQYCKENSMTVKVRPIPEGYHALTPYLCSLREIGRCAYLKLAATTLLAALSC